MLNFICHSCGSKDRPTISKFNTAVLFASFCFQRLIFLIHGDTSFSSFVYETVVDHFQSHLPVMMYVVILLTVCWLICNPVVVQLVFYEISHELLLLILFLGNSLTSRILLSLLRWTLLFVRGKLCTHTLCCRYHLLCWIWLLMIIFLSCTYYVLFYFLKFDTDNVVQNTLSINEDLLSTKYKDKLEPSYKVIIVRIFMFLFWSRWLQIHYYLNLKSKPRITWELIYKIEMSFLDGFFIKQGLIHDVFTTVLRGLSGSKVTKPGKFRSCQDGYAVKSSLKAEDGLLYPLEKSFFFLPKPPTLILHEEVHFLLSCTCKGV